MRPSAPGARPTLERLIRWRNRTLASARFRRWAQRVPGLRRVARGRARDLFALTSGFVNSQVLLACVDLGLLDHLAEAPADASALAGATGLDPARMTLLLDAASSLALTQHVGGGRYLLGPLGATLQAEPGIRAMVRHHRALYADLEDPVALLRGPRGQGRLARLWAYAGTDHARELETDAVAEYTELMGASQRMVAEQVLDSFDFSRFESLLDVGGGNGSFLAAVAARHPGMALSLFDLPPVARLAAARAAELGLAERITTHGGDFHADALPGDQPLVSLVRILHDHDDGPALSLLRKVHDALRPDGTVLIAEPLRETPGAEAMGAAYFGFYLLAMGSGRPRTFEELGHMLGEAGFDRVRRHPTPVPLICSVVSARPARHSKP